VNAGYKLVPDAKAARPCGDGGVREEERGTERGTDDEPSAEQRAFTRLTRGVHW
jgi:hypothetical protein